MNLLRMRVIGLLFSRTTALVFSQKGKHRAIAGMRWLRNVLGDITEVSNRLMIR